MGIRSALARWLDPELGRREETIASLTLSLRQAFERAEGTRDVLRSLVRAVEGEFALGAVSARLRNALVSAKGAIGDTLVASHDTLNGEKARKEPPRACKLPYPEPAPRKETAADRLAESWSSRPSVPVEPTVAFFDEAPDPSKYN